ncbi:MAG: hypothetical protein IIB35_02055 [Gemmatimonadetes bacterium]|nr:hypothetical protein [Gemmatimonadota bacterium]MCH8936378.1 hypothetical protein [Gemmatimonadota bacterium]
MKRTVGFVCLGAALLAGPAVQAQETPLASPREPTALFSSHDIIELTIEAPFKKVFRERSQEPEQFPAVLGYVDASGEKVSIDLKINTRGRFRLRKRTCNFPPIRLDLPKNSVGGTIMAGQNRIKLVTHCQDKRDDYEQYVLQEYLIYRMYNLLSDVSFNVRLARITYIDTEEDRDPLTKYGFLIEDKDDMAERNGWEAIEDVPAIPPDMFDPLQICIVGLFQFMIGNTDWSAYKAPEGETDCCHNTKVVGTMAGPIVSVPYDFDMSGIISTRYAQVAEGLDIRNVRQRLYRGRCMPEDILMAGIELFLENREGIYELYANQTELDPKVLEKTVKYLDEFFEIISSEKKMEREIMRDCRRF